MIANGKPQFYTSLVNVLLEGLVKPSGMDPNHDYIKGPTYQWLVHLVTSQKWGATCESQGDSQTLIIETSLLNPTTWTHRLAREILRRADEDFRQLWAPLHEASVSSEFVGEDDLSPARPVDNSQSASNPKRKRDAVVERENEISNKSPRFTRAGAIATIEPSGPTSGRQESYPDRGWRLWEGGWVAKPIGT